MSSDTTVVRFNQHKVNEEDAPAPTPAPAQPQNGGGSVAVERRIGVQIPTKKAPVELAYGRGLDVGTANMLSAVATEDGEVIVKRERNAFLEIPSSSGGGQDMLTKLNVPFVSHRDRLFVLGDVSFELANMFGKEVRRPMQDGFLSPGEQDAIPIMRFLMERLLGKPREEGEPVHFCIPAPSIDRDNDTVYHEGIVYGILKKLGYSPKSMNEGHAVVYSELADSGFTGIGVSCGGGMFNVCIAYKTIPAITFSVARGGDWIDRHVSKVMGIPQVRATSIKEGNVDLMNPRTREEEAVVLYYRNLISYVLKNLKQRFQLARDVPQFTDPIEVVCGGGTSMVGGFTEVFADELAKVDFPLPIASVRRADDPMSSVVRGTLIAAAIENE
jgi:hypothetical protein